MRSYLQLCFACFVLCLVEGSVSSQQACPLLGQQYPAPKQLSQQPQFQNFTKLLDAALNERLATSPFNHTTFSIGIFSPTEEGLLYEYHHASTSLIRGANRSDVAQKVDSNSIYRLGSISKLLTMYVWLLSDGDQRFGQPIAEYVPELLQVERSGTWNPLTPDWREITIGDLAGQMGGLARDYAIEDLAPARSAELSLPASVKARLPRLPSDELPKCGTLKKTGSLVFCSESEYLQGVASESPVFQTAYTPVYSNEAFAVLGIALARIANTTLETVFNKYLVDALALNGTLYGPPSSSTPRDIIPEGPLSSGWNTDLGVFSAAGGYFSSTNDLAIIGNAILNSSLLSRSQTNRWLKPTSFVEAFDQGVGRPWEIYRVKVNGHTVDLYTKSGDWDAYHSTFAIIPSYNVGYSILTADDPGSGAGSTVRDRFPNIMVDILLPVLNSIAIDQAGANFAGSYTSQGTNSSLTVEADVTGLKVTQWIYNGVNLLEDVISPLVPDAVYRIMPNHLFEGDKVGFTSFYESLGPPTSNDMWYGPCEGWTGVDAVTYGNIPLGQMAFEVDSAGKAVSVELRALRTTLEQTG